MNTQPEVKVEQCDREAAANFLSEHPGFGNPDPILFAEILEGLRDNSRTVQAFARHRLPTPSPSVDIEALRASVWREAIEAASDKCIEQAEVIGAQTGSSIWNALWTSKQAIRSLLSREGRGS